MVVHSSSRRRVKRGLSVCRRSVGPAALALRLASCHRVCSSCAGGRASRIAGNIDELKDEITAGKAVIAQLRSELAESQSPHLRIVFDKTTSSFHYTVQLDGRIRHLRLSIQNTGESIDDVAIKVTHIKPQPPGAFPMQELRLTHKGENDSRISVHRSSQPLTFVDFITQALDPPDRATSQILIDFAGGRRELPLTEPVYFLRCEI